MKPLNRNRVRKSVIIKIRYIVSHLYLYLAGFFGCAAVIVFSGTKLTKYGDKIAGLTGWGNAWVGLILLASLSSLPELLTSIGSVTLAHEPDLAAGNVFGSCVFNLFILSLIDVRIKQPITSLIAYSANAVLVIGVALFLSYFTEQLAHQSGLSNTFFSTLFLAVVTSLPELVVSFAAIRMGAFDLLVGNLLGSNLFNIFVLALTDLFFTEGSLFANVNTQHLESVMVVLIMTAVAGWGFMAKPKKKIWRLGIDTFIILILYIGLMVTLFLKT